MRAAVLQTEDAGELPARATILPLSVEVCTPVSETGGVGALPAAAANFFNKETNTSEPRRRSLFYVRHTEQVDGAGAESQLAGDQRAHAAGGLLHDGYQRGHRAGD